MRIAATFILLIAVGPASGAEPTVVRNVAELRAATADAKPGDHIRIAPGKYPGGITLTDVRGTAEQRIVIEGDSDDPPTFEGGSGLHLVDPAYLDLRHIVIANAAANGINIDDGGQMDQSAVGVTLSHVTVRGSIPRGNLDGIKLSGLRDFVIEHCTIENWGDGGSGIDMVGCADGRIADCTIQHKSNTSTSSGIQAKGGTKDVVIERNWIIQAGRRGVNLGGSTGDDYFRPALQPKGNVEATRITVGGNTFVGCNAPIVYVTSTDCTVESNLIHNPGKWVIRILQEKPLDRFEPASRGVFRKNVVLWDNLDANRLINIGPNTRPETFTFERNVWTHASNPKQSRPTLPVAERNGAYGVKVSLATRHGEPHKPLMLDDVLSRKVGPGSWQSPGEDGDATRRRNPP